MHRSSSLTMGIKLALLVVAVLTFAVGCGGGGSGGERARAGKDTPPTILDLQTPSGLQGKRGADPVSGFVNFIFSLRDRQWDPVDVLEVEYGIDPDLTDNVITYVYAPATEALDINGDPVGDGSVNLDASPGAGAQHFWVWDSDADIGTGRHVTLDFVYTNEGRVAKDQYGDDIFQEFAGCRLRFRPVVAGVPGDWSYTEPFSVNNNRVPWAEFTGIDLQGEPVPNEDVLVNWKGYDEDNDSLTIAADWTLLPEAYDYTVKTIEELAEELQWNPATAASIGEGTFGLTASATGVDHQFGWESMSDAGAVSDRILLRFRPLDAKREVGLWAYQTVHIDLDNFGVLNDPGAQLPGPRSGHTATFLMDNTILLVGGGDAGGTSQNTASIFYPSSTQTTTGNVAPTSGPLGTPRRGHTATRLLADPPANPGDDPVAKVVIVGGTDDNGVALDSIEIYDPETKTFSTSAAVLSSARTGHMAVLLRGGNVLIAGGMDENGNYLDTADVYDPVNDSMVPFPDPLADTMSDARAYGQAIMLPGVDGGISGDGWVLIAGGQTTGGAALDTYEIFDEVSLSFLNVTGTMEAERIGLSLTATLDPTWVAVAAGGMASPPVNSIERFDPVLMDWVDTGESMREARAYHGAALLGDGTILFAGGQMDEAGNSLSTTTDIYDPTSNTVSVPNGDLLFAARDAAVASIRTGRPVFFGGVTDAGPTDAIMVFTPPSEDGFNHPPQAQVRTPVSAEPWSFGARINWRAFDREGDDVRIVARYQIRDDLTDDSGALDANLKNRWLPATMKENTVLGEFSSGITAQGSRMDYVSQGADPIDYPDMFPNDPNYVPNVGEHLYVWDAEADIPKGDYNNVFFQITVYGAVEGETATSARFSIAKNAPVIGRIDQPLTDGGKVFGNLVFPFYLQDSDEDLARVVWDYAVDRNLDGFITDADKKDAGDDSPWYPATHAQVTRDIGGDVYTDAGVSDVATDKDDNPDAGGIPYGQLHHFIWDAADDVGFPPVGGRTDLFIRLTPYDYPTSGTPQFEQSLGIGGVVSGFTLERDPQGLWLESWRPEQTTSSGPGYNYTDVGYNEKLIFEFSQAVDRTTVSTTTIRVSEQGGGQVIGGTFEFANGDKRVIFWPKVQELPNILDVPKANTGYDVDIAAFDFENENVDQTTVKKAGANTADSNDWNLIEGTAAADALMTGSTPVSDGSTPGFVNVVQSTDAGGNPTFEARFDERLLHTTVAGNLSAWVQMPNGVLAYIPGTFTLRNRVDASGATAFDYADVIFTPTLALPANTTVYVRASTAIQDVSMTALGAEGNGSFPTGAGTAGSTTWNETFDNNTNRDGSQTTGHWGTTPPPINPDNFTGKAGAFTGLYEFGLGTDGALNTTGTWTYTYHSALGGYYYTRTLGAKSDYHYTSINLPSNYLLSLTGSKPISIRSQGAATIAGRIIAIGGNGRNGYYRQFRSSGGTVSLPAGGTGVAGGGDGGGGGSYTSYTGPNNGTFNGFDGEDENGNVGGAHAGKGGDGLYASAYLGGSKYTSSNGHGVEGGGGGGHAAAGGTGDKGDTSMSGWSGKTGGTGGTAWGQADLSNGLEPGTGGGMGGHIQNYRGSTTYRYFNYGGSGGAGGGAFKLVAGDEITLTSTSVLSVKGGNGGRGYGRYTSSSANWYINSGAGGAGSGGSIELVAPDYTLSGTIDVSGGSGGTEYYAGSDTKGGDGAGGHLAIATDKSSWSVAGTVSYGTSTVVCSGTGTADWTVSSNIEVDTDTGRSRTIGTTSWGSVLTYWNSGDKKFYVKDFKINSGSTLKVIGSKPFIVHASGDVTIDGTLDGSGEDKETVTQYGYVYSYGRGTFKVFQKITYTYQDAAKMNPEPGEGGAGGGDGGHNGAGTTAGRTGGPYTDSYGTYYYYSTLPNATDGQGYNAASNGPGRGVGGRPATGSRIRRYGSYYYYYYGGSGSGGNSVTQGENGWNRLYSNIYGGTSGSARSETVNLASLSFTNMYGGGGGGGGATGGYSYYTGTSTRYTYGFGAGGGGGGAGIGICAKGDVSLSGTINLKGGDGGGFNVGYSPQYRMTSGGGGGGGGNFLLHAEGDFTFASPTINAGAGLGGTVRTSTTTTYFYGYAGDGGTGGIRVTAPTTPSLPELSLDPNKFVFGLGGKLGTKAFALSDTGVSTWQDTGYVAPTYTSAAAVMVAGTGTAQVWVQGANTNPGTGLIDLNNMSAWVDASGSMASLAGYRFFRFRITLSGAPGKIPECSDVNVTYGYDVL